MMLGRSDMSDASTLRRLRRCQREGQPDIPTCGPVLGRQFAVGFETQVSLPSADREKVAELRSQSGNAGLKVTKLCTGTAVAGDLLEEITRDSGLKMPGGEE